MTDFENTFTHDNKIYDLKKINRIMQSKPSFTVDIKDLVWVLKHDTPEEDRVLKAKLRFPLLVTKWHGKWCVIDGIHRLERYRRKGIKTIPVKDVPDYVLRRCEIIKKTLFKIHK